MCKTNQPSRRSGATLEMLFPFKLFFALTFTAVLMLFVTAHAQTQDVDDQYVHVLATAQQGDALKTSGDNNGALAKYREAQTALQVFRKDHAIWNPKVVAYRAAVIADKIAALSGETPGATVMPSTGDTHPAQTAPKTATPTSGQAVKLLEAGAEPRKMLRLHPKAGDKQTILMTMKMAMEMQMGETQVPAMKLPPMTMTMDTTIKNVSADGDINYETVISDASVSEEPGVTPQVAEAMKTQLAGIKGLTGTGTASSRGINKKSEMKAPPGADPQLRQVMDQMKDTFANVSAPFPEEAVGPGAKWEARKPIKSQGMTINQTAAYELVSIDGDRLSTKATITQSAANQKIQNPAMPAIKLDLTKMTGTGSGDFTFDLAQPLPSQGKLDMHSELLMGANTGGEKQTMTMKMDLNLRLESK